MTDPGGNPTPGELARQVREVLSRFEKLISQVEERYVRKDLLELYKESMGNQFTGFQQSIQQLIAAIQQDVTNLGTEKVNKTEYNALEKRVAELEDNNKWLFRLVIGFIVLGILGAVFVTGSGK